ncbi:hypothetical protein ACIOHH_37840 [Streptomyces microflavus]|uniref:hypothetical protein n=1 Tax=Streptomyces microflavus TaxID=1919 RepID=UPI0038206A82
MMIRHKVKEKPLTPVTEPGSGFVSTYSALVTNESVFLEWAAKHRGRFLLVADEAQFCGDTTDPDAGEGGTRAGALIKQMHEYARHTLLLTGMPNRADNQRLVLADYEPHPTDPRREVLVHHAEALTCPLRPALPHPTKTGRRQATTTRRGGNTSRHWPPLPPASSRRVNNLQASTANAAVSVQTILTNTTGSDVTAALCRTGAQGGVAQTWTLAASSSFAYLLVEDCGSADDYTGQAIT